MDLEVMLAAMLAITTLLTAVSMVLAMYRRNAGNDSKA
jgi:hypothetical protein